MAVGWLDSRRIMKITKDTILADLLENLKAREILAKYNLPCLDCPMAQYEMKSLKIGQVCKMYNIDIKKLLKEMESLFDPSS